MSVSSTDAASWALVSNLRSIRPLHTQSRIVFDVAEGVELTNNAAVYNPEGSINGFWGEMVKTGDGTLVLGSSNRHPPGCGEVEVRPFLGDLEWAEGALATPRGPVGVKVRKRPDGSLKVDVTAPDGVKVRIRTE